MTARVVGGTGTPQLQSDVFHMSYAMKIEDSMSQY